MKERQSSERQEKQFHNQSDKGKDRHLAGKKLVFTTIHVIGVIFLVLSICGIAYTVDAVGGSIYEMFRETNAPVETRESFDETEQESATEKTGETKRQETTTAASDKNNISYQDKNFREKFYGQVQEAIEYTWYVRAFEDADGEIDLNKMVVAGKDGEDRTVEYTIQDLIHYTERYGTYDTGRKQTEGDEFADYYWDELIGVNWCSFDATFDLENRPGAPIAYENRLVGITNVFNQQMERYLSLKEKFTGKNSGLFFQIAYHIDDGPEAVTVTNHEQAIDYKKMDAYFVLHMPESDVDTNLSGYTVYDLPEITNTAHTYKISAQPVYTVIAGWADSKETLSEAVRSAGKAAKESENATETEESEAAQETDAGQPETLEGKAKEAAGIPVIPNIGGNIDQRQQAFYRDMFTISLATFIGSLILAVSTLIWMIFHTGKVVENGEEKYVLRGMDLWHWEITLTVVIGLLLFWNWLPVIHSENDPFPMSRIMGWLGSYFIVLAGGLSFVRRFRAGSDMENSLIKEAGERANRALRVFSENQKPVNKIIIVFVAWTAIHMLTVWWLTVSIKAYNINQRNLYLGQTVIAVLILMILYGVVLTVFLRKAVERQKILQGVEQISQGRLEKKINLEELTGNDRGLADSINHIGDGLLSAVGTATKSERMKTELITNVSHDIKTPLTSIINYVDLLKRENIQDPKVNNYIHVLDQKSQRLKNLIEDLVEASKASSGNVALELEKIDFCQLVKQIDGEFQVRFQEARLQMVTTIPENSIYIHADGRRIWRILENLYQNALKYAMKDSRVYIGVVPYNDTVSFVMKNVSASPLNFEAQELTERFIRGDVARTTEGSGLGLSIAKSLTELHSGEFQVYLDGDLFKVSVTFQTIDH